MPASDDHALSVEQAMRAVPRAAFLPADERKHADADTPLPIDCGQTISQPSLVAWMTRELGLTPLSRVLEIGTGSGYQTAILAELAAEVFTIERIAALALAAQGLLEGMGYRNVHCRHGDGAAGWPEAAPFHAIIVTAAAPAIPPALPQQLLTGGRLVIPVGTSEAGQELLLVQKRPDGKIRSKVLCDVRFVPLLAGTV